MMADRRCRRVAIVGLAALAGFSLLAPPAGAHAWLLAADPGPNAHRSEPPSVVWFQFTENIEQEFTRAEVLDVNGTRVDAGRLQFHPGGRPNELLLFLAALRDGVYTVRWYTLSVDTHTAQGSYVFAVGTASLEGAPAPEVGHHVGVAREAYWLEAGSRGLFFAGLLVATGLAAFAILILRPRAARNEDPERLARVLFVATAAAAAGVIGGLLVLVAFAERVEVPLWAAAATVRTGRYLGARTLLLLAAAAGFAVARRMARANLRAAIQAAAAGGGLGMAALLATSLSSHAAALAGSASLPVLADAVHLFVGALWTGGLVGLAVAAPGRTPLDLVRLVFRFSPWAMSSVVLLVVTGVYAGTLHLERWSDLWSSGYGRAVLVKSALLVPLVLLGAWNRYRVAPRLRERRSPPASLLRPVLLEILLLGGVLAAAGVLATTAPPTDRGAAPVGAEGLKFERSLRTVHVVFTILPNPPRIGIQDFTVTLHSTQAGAQPDGTEVYLKFAPPNQTEPEELVPTKRISAEAWTLSGGYLTERGVWTTYVILQRPDEYAKLEFAVRVS